MGSFSCKSSIRDILIAILLLNLALFNSSCGLPNDNSMAIPPVVFNNNNTTGEFSAIFYNTRAIALAYQALPPPDTRLGNEDFSTATYQGFDFWDQYGYSLSYDPNSSTSNGSFLWINRSTAITSVELIVENVNNELYYSIRNSADGALLIDHSPLLRGANASQLSNSMSVANDLAFSGNNITLAFAIMNFNLDIKNLAYNPSIAIHSGYWQGVTIL